MDTLTPAAAAQAAAGETAQRGKVRLVIALMLFMATAINYADRATISIAGPDMAKELGLTPVQMGYVFSAFAWSYVLAQIPGGWLLDRFGVKWVYAASIAIWSGFTLMQGAVGFFTGLTAVILLFALRLLVGLSEAPPSRPTPASSPRGSPPRSAGWPRRSSTRRNISPPCCSPR